MKRIYIIVGAIVGIAALIPVVGLFVPKSHVAVVTAQIPKPVDSVWAVISDIPKVPEWFKEVTAVEPLPDQYGHKVWRETYSGSVEVTVVHTVEEPPRRLVREIQPGGAFHGSWTFELGAVGGGTRLTVTERGTLENPFFRGLMVFHDNSKTARDFVAALIARLNGTQATR